MYQGLFLKYAILSYGMLPSIVLPSRVAEHSAKPIDNIFTSVSQNDIEYIRNIYHRNRTLFATLFATLKEHSLFTEIEHCLLHYLPH